MNFKKKIWDFFKQKDDIVDHGLNQGFAESIKYLGEIVRNLEIAVSDLEKKYSGMFSDMSKEVESVSEEIAGVKSYVSDLEKVYGFKIKTIIENKNGKK